MVIEVTEVLLEGFEDGNSMVEARGTVVSNGSDDSHLLGKTVRFAGDWRPMLHIYEALESTENDTAVLAEVEDWAITAVEA